MSSGMSRKNASERRVIGPNAKPAALAREAEVEKPVAPMPPVDRVGIRSERRDDRT